VFAKQINYLSNENNSASQKFLLAGYYSG